MIIAGFVTVGFFYWGYSLTKEIYPVPLTMFMSGCVGYIVGGMLTPKKKEEDENLSKLD